MNEQLHKFIGKPVTVIVKLFIDETQKEEHLQGILKGVENEILIIEQHILFCNLFVKDAKTLVCERKINIQNTINGGIQLF